MDLVFIVIFETEYSIAFSWNPLLLLAKWSAILIRMNPLFVKVETRGTDRHN